MRTRTDIAWIALALTIGAGGAAYATTSSDAGTSSVPAGTAAALAIAAATDPALTSNDPADSDAAARLAQMAGVAGETEAPQAWSVGGRSVLGYRAGDGRFCFEFRRLSGGCLRTGTLDDEQPLDITVDHGPATFRIYGLALDGVTAVTVRIGDRERRADLAHNAFSFSDDALGATSETSGELVASMSDGTSRTQTFPISSLAAP